MRSPTSANPIVMAPIVAKIMFASRADASSGLDEVSTTTGAKHDADLCRVFLDRAVRRVVHLEDQS